MNEEYIYKLDRTSAFKHDLKIIQKRGYNLQLLKDVVEKLLKGEELPEKNKDHALTGDWNGYRECHIQPDWLLIYKVYDDTLVLLLSHTGTHSNLF